MKQFMKVKFIHDPSLTRENRPQFCPEKMAKAWEFVNKVKNWPPELADCNPRLYEKKSND